MFTIFLYFFTYFFISHILLILSNSYYRWETQDTYRNFITNGMKIIFIIFSPFILIWMFLNYLWEWLWFKDLGYFIWVMVLIPTGAMFCLVLISALT